jgi:cephalosporin hydroxylase
MLQLIDLVDNTKTDKNTCHSYIPVYQKLFESKKYDTNNILEIGIGEPKQNKENGGSIKLWHDYFSNSTIYGLDIHDISDVNEEIIDKQRIKLYTSVDAYDTTFIENTFIKNNIQFDILIDDGPHTLDSMIFFVKHYLPLLKDDGVLVIEDIPDMNWTQILKENTPEDLRQYVKCFDLRSIKNRWDDIMFVIQK